MKTVNRTLETASQDLAEAAPKRRYDAPELRVVASAVEMVQGCGGASGQDRSYYRIFCQ